MNVIQAIDILASWPESTRRSTFDIVCQIPGDDGEPIDCWTSAAVALADMCGYLDVCDTGEELEAALREAVATYIESGIVSLEQVRDHALVILRELLRWGDAAVCN